MRTDLADMVRFLIETGEAQQLGRVLGEAFGEALAKSIPPPAHLLNLDGRPSRHQLAAMAMQGLLAFSGMGRELEGSMTEYPEGVALDAYRIADAMIAKQREGDGQLREALRRYVGEPKSNPK